MKTKPIEVTSHVSRDFLQNAAYFNSLPKVIWEYVSNSLDSAKDGSMLNVVVEMRTGDKLTVSDNGEGMTRDGLRNFFTMHGENIYRKSGKRVRGLFGTGKSAAFGIAKCLTIDTRCNGRRNVVQLRLDNIKSAQDGAKFPVKEIVADERTAEMDGTVIEISDFLTTNLDIGKSISYVEKHLSRYRTKARVVINDHICSFKEPPFTLNIRISSPPSLHKEIGSVELNLKTAPFALEKEERGIDVLSHGLWHETTLGDVEGREFSDRLFGEVDVPLLEDVVDDIPPFDNTRNNQLNRANPRVVILIAWLSEELEKVRQQIAEEEKQRRNSEQAKKLKEEAEKLAKVLNEDFKDVLDELELTRKITGKPKSKLQELISDEGEVLPGDGTKPSEYSEAGQKHGNGNGGGSPGGPGDAKRPGPNLTQGDSLGETKSASGKGQKSRTGLFSIEFDNHTVEFQRSKYDRESHTIFVNLDHPQVSNAFKSGGSSLESKHFLEIVYEIAIVEYAHAIPFIRLYQGEKVDTADALFGLRETIDRVTRKLSQA